MTQVSAPSCTGKFIAYNSRDKLFVYPTSTGIVSSISPDLGFECFGLSNLCFSNNGNLGIGTTTPNYKLHVVGDIFATGNITAFSDQRLKTDLQIIEDSIEKVIQCRGYTYKRIDGDYAESETRHVGLIAQELEKVLPEAVSTDADGYKSVNYNNTVALLFEAIREINTKIDSIVTKNKLFV